MSDRLDKILKIRYIKLKFTLLTDGESILPENKTSAIRGGMGEMLLRQNCVRDRNCEACDFETECIVRRTMYSKYRIQPNFSTGNDSIGYVLSCKNYDTYFADGQELNFYLTLFGNTIVYLNQYLMAITALGRSGLGKNKTLFYIKSVYNQWQQPIMENGCVYMENYKVTTIADYVRTRNSKSGINDAAVLYVTTPASITYKKQPLTSFDIRAILENISRKLYMLDCYEGIEEEQLLIKEDDIPDAFDIISKSSSVKRYSSTADAKMTLSGIKGRLSLMGLTKETRSLLFASELTHIGKNTSFGFGSVSMAPCKNN